jgi:Predicted RNA-binding protein
MWMRVNYRAKREQTLEALARKVAAKVVRLRRNVTLEPMYAYERHVIHSALQDYPGVSTGSIGTEPNRRVVVHYGTLRRTGQWRIFHPRTAVR